MTAPALARTSALAALLWSAEATATTPALIQDWPSPPVPLQQPEALIVEREEVLIDCQAPKTRQQYLLSCEIRAQLLLRNTSDVPLELILVDPSLGPLPAGTSRDSLPRIHVAPGGRKQVPFTSAVDLGASYDSPTYDVHAPLTTRHPVLGDNPHRVASRRVVLYKAARWSRVRERRARWLLPPGWEPTTAGWRHSRDLPDGRRELMRTDFDMIRVDEERPVLPLFHGGPFVGAGSVLKQGLVARIGYEVTPHHLAMTSLVVDTDFASHWVAAPLVELGTPSLFDFIPSLAAGVGAPVYLGEDVLAGLRLQLGAHFPMVGFSASFDYLPATRRWNTTLVARLSL